MLGDPTWIGITITFAYLGAAALAAALRGRTRVPSFFAFVAAVMTALGINKEADLQTYVLAIGRALARHALHGVPRVLLRVLLVVAVLVAIAATVLWLAQLVRPAPADARVTSLGLMLLASFVFLRASSFVHLGGVSLFFERHPDAAPFLEVSGILLVALGVAHAVRRKPVES